MSCYWWLDRFGSARSCVDHYEGQCASKQTVVIYPYLIAVTICDKCSIHDDLKFATSSKSELDAPNLMLVRLTRPKSVQTPLKTITKCLLLLTSIIDTTTSHLAVNAVLTPFHQCQPTGNVATSSHIRSILGQWQLSTCTEELEDPQCKLSIFIVLFFFRC